MSRIYRGIPGFIVRRVLLGLLTLFLVSLVVFAATQALPSDPARAILGRTATPESLKALREQLHLNHSVVGQYTHWLGGIFTGDLGNSLAARGEPVTSVLGKRLENSAVLVLLAAAISIPLSILLGVISARRRDGPLDHSMSLVLLALAALPEFVVVEFVFAYPGIGSALVDGVANRDLPIVQALAVLIAAVYVGCNVLADIATILVSPRLRTSLR